MDGNDCTDITPDTHDNKVMVEEQFFEDEEEVNLEAFGYRGLLVKYEKIILSTLALK